MKIRARGLLVAIAALTIALAAGCGGSGSTTSTTGPGPTTSVNAACQQAIGARASIKPSASVMHEIQSDLVHFEKIAKAAQSADADSDVVGGVDALNEDIRTQLIPVVERMKVKSFHDLPPEKRRTIGLIATRIGREADQVEKQLTDAGFKACAGLLSL